MPTIQAQKIPRKIVSSEELLARFCYHFPRYSYVEAGEMPKVRILKMLRVAYKEQARLLYQITQAIASPHTKKGGGVSKMLKYFQDIIEE